MYASQYRICIQAVAKSDQSNIQFLPFHWEANITSNIYMNYESVGSLI